jgi:hypothetical protein
MDKVRMAISKHRFLILSGYLTAGVKPLLRVQSPAIEIWRSGRQPSFGFPMSAQVGRDEEDRHWGCR